jgi:LacI family transcriptional regulator
LAGFQEALAEAWIAFDSSLVEEGLFTFDSGLAAARSLLARRDRPTAIFAQNDDMAAGAIVAARERGLEVPSELSVVGFDDSASARTIWPGITTIAQPICEMGKIATDTLIAMLEARPYLRERRLPTAELLVRGSSGAAPDAPLDRSMRSQASPQ